MDEFDVVIVGSRCAGAALATHLARAGVRVCVLDKARFPSETPSTHVVQPCGVALLDELGVLDGALAAGAVPLEKFTLVNDDVRIDATIDRATFPHPGLCVRRLTLDALLIDAAVNAGAGVRTACRVDDVVLEDDRARGVHTRDGDVRARLVVGADGRLSTVAHAVGATEYLATPAGRIPAWAYFDGVADRDGRLRLGRIGDLAFLASPTDGGLYMAGIAVDVAHAARFHSARDEYFTAALTMYPDLSRLLAGARRVGPIRVMTDWHGYFRTGAGPGWVLVGDAGHFKDFSPAQGISDALRQAERLARSITRGLAPSGDLDAEMHDWWHWRDRDAHDMYWFASVMGRPGPSTPLVTQLLGGIAATPAATTQLLRLLNHDLPSTRVFTTRRVLAATGRSLLRDPRGFRHIAREIAFETSNKVRRQRSRRNLNRTHFPPARRNLETDQSARLRA